MSGPAPTFDRYKDRYENIDAGSFTLSNPADWDHIFFDGRRLLRNLLEIEVPTAY